jgi:hypothetical protein
MRVSCWGEGDLHGCGGLRISNYRQGVVIYVRSGIRSGLERERFFNSVGSGKRIINSPRSRAERVVVEYIRFPA